MGRIVTRIKHGWTKRQGTLSTVYLPNRQTYFTFEYISKFEENIVQKYFFGFYQEIKEFFLPNILNKTNRANVNLMMCRQKIYEVFIWLPYFNLHVHCGAINH